LAVAAGGAVSGTAFVGDKEKRRDCDFNLVVAIDFHV